MDAIGCYFLNNLVLCLYAQRKNDNVLLLKERERMLFISLYGLDETDTRNHTEMAAELGLCKERIRQLEWKSRCSRNFISYSGENMFRLCAFIIC